MFVAVTFNECMYASRLYSNVVPFCYTKALPLYIFCADFLCYRLADFKELKEDIKILDQKFTTRHSTIIDTVNNLIQANEQKSDEKNVKNQKRVS